MFRCAQVLPYDLTLLEWDDLHATNTSGKYCYCGGDRIPGEAMLKCDGCGNMFHGGAQPCSARVLHTLACVPSRMLLFAGCVACYNKRPMWGWDAYTFLCAVCGSGTENLTMLGVVSGSCRWHGMSVCVCTLSMHAFGVAPACGCSARGVRW